MYLLRKGGSCSFLISMSKFRSFPHFAPLPSPTFSFLLCLFQFASILLNSLLSIPPSLSLCHIPFSNWYLKGGISAFLVSYFHILSVSSALGSFRFILILPSLCVLHCAPPFMENGVSLIALHFDWHGRVNNIAIYMLLCRKDAMKLPKAFFLLIWIIFCIP